MTIQEELEHVRNYLVIQQMRYRDILDYEIDVHPDIYACTMLKMTLQPLVENALYHGIKNKRGKGTIRITGQKINDRHIVMTIEDNGMGMPEDVLARLSDRLNQLPLETAHRDEKDGFGLFNVQQRIRLYYGSEYGLQLTSEQGHGTTIHIHFPVQRGESA